jgi:hypothetical protein
MTKHCSCRLLPILALALSLAGCGALQRKTEPALAATAPGDAAEGANLRASPEVASESAATGTSEGYPQGIRPGDPRLRLNLHVFGFSYHLDREGTRDRHLDNELNLGLGLNYELHNDAQGVTSVETGFFKDSGRNWAKFAGLGYQFKLGDNWRLGGDLLAIQSRTYNNGHGFVAAIPRLTYDFGAVKLNAIYIPQVREFNEFAVFGFYFTVPTGTW